MLDGNRIAKQPRTSPKGRPICTRTVKLPGDGVWNAREQRWEAVQQSLAKA